MLLRLSRTLAVVVILTVHRFIENAAKNIPNYAGENGAEKLAAHMMGRWKSGIVAYLSLSYSLC